jgi:hypothetical protein
MTETTTRLLSPEGERLARVALARIDADPSSFDQGSWGYEGDCGTVACLAGHVAMAAGATFDRGVYRYLGGAYDAESLAVELLGTDQGSADVLFDGANSRADLGRMIDDLAAGRAIEYPGWPE